MNVWVVEIRETSGYNEIFVYDSELKTLRAILYLCIAGEIKIDEMDLIENEYKFTILSDDEKVTIDVYKKELNPQFIG